MSDETKPLEVALCILKNKTGKVLIVNRLHVEKAVNDQKLTWVFPGGAVGDNESHEEALTREVRAETGFLIKLGKKISERVYPLPYVHLNYYECELASPKVVVIQAVHEIKEMKWVNPSDLTNYFTTDMDPVVAKFLGL